MNFKTIPVAVALLSAVSLTSLAIAAPDNIDPASVRGFDTVAPRPVADVPPPCPYYDDFGPRHHRMLRSPVMAERYGQQVDELDKIESQLFVERKVLKALERADDPNVQEIRKQAQTVADLESQKRENLLRTAVTILALIMMVNIIADMVRVIIASDIGRFAYGTR